MLAIIIVNFNGWKDSVECIESILRLDRADWHLFVVDNSSTDDSVEIIVDVLEQNSFVRGSNFIWNQIPEVRNVDPRLEVIEEGEIVEFKSCNISIIKASRNRGFAAGNNIALKMAKKSGLFKYYWILNNDTVVCPRSATGLIDKATKDSELGIVGSTLIYFHNPEKVQSLGMQYDLLTTRSHSIGHMDHPENCLSPDVVDPLIDYVPGASMLISERFLSEIGLMTEDYFLYFEELDYALRSRGRFKQGWSKESIVYHKEGGSIGTSATARPSSVSIYYMTRAMLIFYTMRMPGLLPVAFARVVFNFARFAAGLDIDACRMVFAAIRDFCTGVRGGPSHPTMAHRV